MALFLLLLVLLLLLLESLFHEDYARIFSLKAPPTSFSVFPLLLEVLRYWSILTGLMSRT